MLRCFVSVLGTSLTWWLDWGGGMQRSLTFKGCILHIGEGRTCLYRLTINDCDALHQCTNSFPWRNEPNDSLWIFWRPTFSTEVWVKDDYKWWPRWPQGGCVDAVLELLSMLPTCVVICFPLAKTEDAAVNWSQSCWLRFESCSSSVQ